MLKKIIAITLSILMLISICSCKSEPDNSSSDTIEVEFEEIVVDQSGNTISSSTTTSSEQDITSTQTPDTSSNQNINDKYINYNTVVEVDICDDVVRGYLDAKDAYNQYYWLSAYNGQRFDYQNVNLDWNIDRSSEYTIYFSENADFSNSHSVKTRTRGLVKHSILIPGKTYYWKVVGTKSTDTLGGGIIKVKDAPVRWIYLDGIRNIRDMGGWKTTSGKKVKYGMLYRGAQLNTEKDGAIVNAVSASALNTFNSLGIKTEFDLRSMQNVHVKTEGTNLNHVLLSNDASAYSAYDSIYAESQKEKYITMFNYLSDKNNYPIYAHCQGGADRTGSYAFLLNGLLGVPYDDLVRDFEMTSFAGTTRWRSAGSANTFGADDEDYVDGGVTVKWRAMYNKMMEYGKQNGCTTLEQSIEHWFINDVGVPKSQIDSFKSIMLE